MCTSNYVFVCTLVCVVCVFVSCLFTLLCVGVYVIHVQLCVLVFTSVCASLCLICVSVSVCIPALFLLDICQPLSEKAQPLVSVSADRSTCCGGVFVKGVQLTS